MSEEATQTTSGHSSTSEPKLYSTPSIIAVDELDKLKKVVYLFSCYRKVSGVSSNVLRKKLILLLSIYLKFGCNSKTKAEAATILKVNKAAINSMNLELRNDNYLIQDPMNTRINHLHSDLDILSEYVKGDTSKLLFLFTIEDEGR